MMGLTRVTITGADDRTPIGELIKLSEEFPFLEVGILMSMKRRGESRYPSTTWLNDFYQMYDPRPFAWHLCGEFSRTAMANSDEWQAFTPDRVQLNGFPTRPFRVHELAVRFPDTEFILQVRKAIHHNVARACALGSLGNVVALNDVSGGTGVAAEIEPIEGMRTGYGGGIGPDNVVETIEKILAKTKDDFWIDMESGVRTDDRFDLEKVRYVLKLAAPYIAAEPCGERDPHSTRKCDLPHGHDGPHEDSHTPNTGKSPTVDPV